MGPSMHRLLTVALVILTMAPSIGAAQGRLQSGGMDLHLFRPAVDSKGLFGLNGTDVLGAGDFSFGLVLDGGFGLVPFDGFVNDDAVSAEDAERVDRLVESFFAGTLHFNYGIGNTFVAGVQVPIEVVSGSNVTAPGQYNDAATTTGLDVQGLGSVVLHGKVRLTRVEQEAIGLAALVHVGLPTADAERFGGESGVSVWPVLAAEWRPVRELRLVANVGYRLDLGAGAHQSRGCH